MLELGDPRINWIALASALGIEAHACSNAAEFDLACRNAMGVKGPRLIEASLG